MTETPPIPNTHSTANLFPVTAPTVTSPVVNGTQPHHEEEDEPYTIKCICAFEDDDGSTVFCERCETWQHIVCYYDDQEVPDIHNCADCEPRPLDSKRATERQKKLREQNESGDRKTKRSGSKGQKKKVKDPGSALEQSNGSALQERSIPNSSQRDLPPPPKKSRHQRASASVSSLTGASDARKRRSSTATPSGNHNKSSSIVAHHPLIPLYSPEFLHLYDLDRMNVNMQCNLFDTIGLAGDLASWVQDPSALAQVSNGRTPKDVFTHSDQPLDPAKWPLLTQQTDFSVDYDGRHPMWKLLKVEDSVRKDEIVGEVRGKVGHFHNYCLDPNSRWQELRHPEPFVFFHPQLPIYIDSREEGTRLRYIRRSCRPNVTMKTFITNKVEYHFCFVANQDIPANAEITTTWYLDPQMFPSNGKLVKQDGSNDGIQDSAAICISNVLAHFGGCACDPSQPCLLSKLDLRRPPKSLDSNSKPTNGKRKRNKTKTTISPPSTGRATNSRAGSEAAKNQEDEDNTDTRSTSGSVRDHPRSRELTPTGLHHTGGGELSAREKRKIAAVEKKFEQLEHDKQQHHQKRKKRNTSHSQTSVGVNTLSNHSTAPPLSNPPLLDTTNPRQTSGSPTKMSPRPAQLSRRASRASSLPKKPASNTSRIGSPLIRRVYVDSAMQTDPDENDPLYTPPKPVRRRGFVPLTKRLLTRCHEDRLKLKDLGQVDDALNCQKVLNVPVDLVSVVTPMKQPISPQNTQGDVEMKDADTATTPTKPVHSTASSASANDSPSSSTVQPSLYPLPSTAAHRIPVPRKPPGGLRVQLPPSQFPTSPSSMPSMPSNASKMSPPSLQSHASLKSQTSVADAASSVAAPSPVKKKLTLNDYMSRRGTLMTPTTEKSQPPNFPATQTPTSSADGSSPTFSQPGKPAESIKQESPATPDAVMKDVQMSSTPTEFSPSSARDPRLHSRS